MTEATRTKEKAIEETTMQAGKETGKADTQAGEAATETACTADMLGRRPALDLTKEEEFAGGAQTTIATLAGARKMVLMKVESKVPGGMGEDEVTSAAGDVATGNVRGDHG